MRRVKSNERFDELKLDPPADFSVEMRIVSTSPLFKKTGRLNKQVISGQWSVISVKSKIIYEDLKFVILDVIDLF